MEEGARLDDLQESRCTMFSFTAENVSNSRAFGKDLLYVLRSVNHVTLFGGSSFFFLIESLDGGDDGTKHGVRMSTK